MATKNIQYDGIKSKMADPNSRWWLFYGVIGSETSETLNIQDGDLKSFMVASNSKEYGSKTMQYGYIWRRGDVCTKKPATIISKMAALNPRCWLFFGVLGSKTMQYGYIWYGEDVRSLKMVTGISKMAIYGGYLMEFKDLKPCNMVHLA